MRCVWRLRRKSREDESGQALVEYALILSLVAGALIGLLILLGGDIADLIDTVIDAIP